MVDPHNAPALPVGIGVSRELKEFERMAFRIAELDCGHPAGGTGKRYRPLAADRRGAGITGPAPCGLRIVRDEREVLEDKVAGGRARRIRETWRVEAIEIDATSAERHRDSRTGTRKAEKFQVRRGNRHYLADVETDRPIKGDQPHRVSGNETKTCDRLENHVR